MDDYYIDAANPEGFLNTLPTKILLSLLRAVAEELDNRTYKRGDIGE